MAMLPSCLPCSATKAPELDLHAVPGRQAKRVRGAACCSEQRRAVREKAPALGRRLAASLTATWQRSQLCLPAPAAPAAEATLHRPQHMRLPSAAHGMRASAQPRQLSPPSQYRTACQQAASATAAACRWALRAPPPRTAHGTQRRPSGAQAAHGARGPLSLRCCRSARPRARPRPDRALAWTQGPPPQPPASM